MPTEAPVAPAPAPPTPAAQPAPTSPPSTQPIRATRLTSPVAEKARSALRAIAENQPPPETKETPKPEPTVKEKAPPPPPAPAKEPTPPQQKTEPQKEEAKVEAKPAEEKPKLGPWQLKDKYEKLSKTLEKENTDLKQKMASMGDVNALREKAEKLEARNKHLEEVIRHKDYTETEEYKSKWETPLKEAWHRAVSEIEQVTVTDGDGNSRRANANDLYRLVNSDLETAKKYAIETFGDLANYVLGHRLELIKLTDSTNRAVAQAKKEGEQQEKQKLESIQRTTEEIGRSWQEFVASDESKYDFLKEKEGDDEWNNRLSSAKQFVEESFLANAADPNVPAEKRKEIVRNHASIRGRAIGFTMLRLENSRLKSQMAELQKTISEFKKGEPSGGDSKTVQQPTSPLNRMESTLDQLRRLAR